MASYMYVIASVDIIGQVLADTTQNSISTNVEMTSNELVEIDSNEPNTKGLGTKGLIILLAAVGLIFLVTILVALFVIHRFKKKKIEIRANRSSYINHGYEQTESEGFTRERDGSHNSRTVPPIKPTRRSSSKKSQNTCYVNIEIGTVNKPDDKPFPTTSLPRNIDQNVELVVPNLTSKTSSMGSSIPYIDASKENLDIISDRGKTSMENLNINVTQSAEEIRT
ncbi:uncharacterized protein LOC127728335 [Mytilus californianus]|uniref:uncharacterized protein LOC127728335 n=1 Tax=Mytilus californianus TaxID=6549 RepID=UPI002245AA3B|nr:uncharacterized protein LOC127728335 [Mytilus californianus]